MSFRLEWVPNFRNSWSGEIYFEHYFLRFLRFFFGPFFRRNLLRIRDCFLCFFIFWNLFKLTDFAYFRAKSCPKGRFLVNFCNFQPIWPLFQGFQGCSSFIPFCAILACFYAMFHVKPAEWLDILKHRCFRFFLIAPGGRWVRLATGSTANP